jgi:hypothetical protein
MGVAWPAKTNVPRHADANRIGPKGCGVHAVVAVRTFRDTGFCADVAIHALDAEFVEAIVIGHTGTAEFVAARRKVRRGVGFGGIDTDYSVYRGFKVCEKHSIKRHNGIIGAIYRAVRTSRGEAHYEHQCHVEVTNGSHISAFLLNQSPRVNPTVSWNQGGMR